MKYYSYFIHGLFVKSAVLFSELIPVEKMSYLDVNIRYDEFNLVNDSLEINLSDFTKALLTSTEIDIIWNDIPLFKVLNGNEIVINPGTGLEEDFLRLFILGYGFAILLYQRGNLILHANAVNMGTGALILLGSRGSGKSTTSLALHRKGYKLVSDDLLNIEVDDANYPIVSSSFPRIKLWPDVLFGIQENVESIPRIHSKAEKRSYSLANNFSMKYQRIKSFYFLEKSDRTEIEKMTSSYSLLELLKSSYCYKLFNENDLSNNLKQCAKIIKNVPVKKLKVRQSLQDIPQLVKIIEKDFFESQ